jgi:hypothetical protein
MSRRGVRFRGPGLAECTHAANITKRRFRVRLVHRRATARHEILADGVDHIGSGNRSARSVAQVRVRAPLTCPRERATADLALRFVIRTAIALLDILRNFCNISSN